MKVDIDKCIGCTRCVQDCPTDDIEMINKKATMKDRSCIKCGHCVAVCPVFAISSDEYNMDDVESYNKETFEVNSDNLLNLIKFTRSIRSFKKQEVADDLILKVIDAGRFAPSSLNSQDVRYIIVKEKIDLLREITINHMNAYMHRALKFQNSKMIPSSLKKFIVKKVAKRKGIEGIPDDLSNLKEHIVDVLEENEKYMKDRTGQDRIFFEAPILIVVTAKNPVNGAIASENMNLMISSLGLGAFFASSVVQVSKMTKKIHEVLNIPSDEKVVTCLAIGYPNVKYLRTTPKKEPSISWE